MAWESRHHGGGKQMVSGQEKPGLLLVGRGLVKEHGLCGGRPGTRTELPNLAGTGGQLGEAKQGEPNSDSRSSQGSQCQVTAWGCVTTKKVKTWLWGWLLKFFLISDHWSPYTLAWDRPLRVVKCLQLWASKASRAGGQASQRTQWLFGRRRRAKCGFGNTAEIKRPQLDYWINLRLAMNVLGEVF